MSSTLLTAGLACVIAAIVGGGLKAFGIEIPALKSGKRQLGLAIFGMALLVGSVIAPGSERPDPKRANSNREVLFAELQKNKESIEVLERGIEEHAVQYAEQEPRISLQEQRIAHGEGTLGERAEAQAAIEAARSAMRQARKADRQAQEIIGNTKQRNLEIERILANN